MTCKNRCEHFHKLSRKVGYSDTVVGCILCNVMFEYEGIFCPCCGTHVRHSPKKSNKKKVYIE